MSSASASGRDQRGGASQRTVTMPPVPPEVPQPVAAKARRTKPRRARLLVSRVDPWSVMKLSFLLSIAVMIVIMVAVAVLWSVLDRMGVFSSVARAVETVTRERDSRQGFDIMTYIGFGRVMTITALLAGVNVILMTALSTLAAFMYNLAASLVGGLNVTLSEDV